MRAVAAVAVAVVAVAPPAGAICVGPPGPFDTLFALSGQTVPANFAAVMPLSPGPEPRAAARAGDDVIPLRVEFVDGVQLLRPERDLTAGVTYDLCVDDDCVSVVAGPRDDDAPSSPDAELADVHGYTALARECGGAESATVVVFTVAPAPDVHALFLHRTLSAQRALVDTAFADTFSDGEDVALIDHAEPGGAAVYEIVVVDDAGNFSEPNAFPVELGCAGGCTAGGGLSPAALLVVVVVAVRRRRLTAASAHQGRADRCR